MGENISIKDLEKLLERLGFSDYKKRVYKALFELGESSIPEIGKRSHVPLPKVYGVAEELESEGFISMTLAKPKKYVIIDPKVVIDKIIELKQQEITDLKQSQDHVAKLLQVFQTKQDDDFIIMRHRDKILHYLSKQVQKAKKCYWACVAFNASSTPLMEILKHKIKEGFEVRIIGYGKDNFIVQKYKNLGCKVRITDTITPPMRFSLFDQKFLALTLADEKRDYVTLWTNSKPLVNSMLNLFQHYWGLGKEPK